MRARISSLLHWRYLVPALIAAFAVGIAAVAGVLVYTSELEKDNQFCGSCHTQPESTYLMRFQNAGTQPAADLASFHYVHSQSSIQPLKENIRCIDCHVGEGVLGRAIVVSLSGFDAFKYYTGTAQQPAKVVFSVQNEACIKCHEEEVKKFLDQPEKPFIIDNHYHYKLFTPGAPYEACVACHPSHREGSELNQFQFRRVTVPVCEDCHRQEGHGPVKMQ